MTSVYAFVASSLVVASSLALIGCQPAKIARQGGRPASKFAPVPKPDAAIQSAQAKVLANLKDPDSAKFSDVHLVHLTSGGKGSSIDAICGLVNARNGFGGYTGPQPFAYVAKIDDKAPAEMSIDHYYAEQLAMEDVGNFGVAGAFANQDVDHLCGYTTRYDTDQELMENSLGHANEAQQRINEEFRRAAAKRVAEFTRQYDATHDERGNPLPASGDQSPPQSDTGQTNTSGSDGW